MPGMNQSDRAETLTEILRRRVGAIIRTKDAQLAADAMNAAVAGGIRMVEFTLTTPDALRLITDFAQRPDLLVGAGTVLTPAEARAAVRAGARFLVSPVCDPAVIAEAGALGAACIPGASTPTEMLTAHRAGADLVKLFPAPADVADFVSAVLGPLPFLRIYPTAGITVENFVDILRAGASGVGFVRSLFVPEELAAGNFAAIQARATEITRRLADA